MPKITDNNKLYLINSFFECFLSTISHIRQRPDRRKIKLSCGLTRRLKEDVKEIKNIAEKIKDIFLDFVIKKNKLYKSKTAINGKIKSFMVVAVPTETLNTLANIA